MKPGHSSVQYMQVTKASGSILKIPSQASFDPLFCCVIFCFTLHHCPQKLDEEN